MDKSVKISVIVPIYNVEKYIYFFLETVVNQSLKDIEIICVFDGEIDNSKEIVESFAMNDNRFRFICQENQGTGIAKNNGLKGACGEFVSFLDPDDMLPAKNTLELLYNSAKANNVKICGGSLIDIREGFWEPSNWLMQCFIENKKIKYIDYQFCYNYQRFIYDRKFLLENNLFFPELRRGEDPIWFVKTMHTAGEFFAITPSTYAYRLTNNSMTNNKTNLLDSITGFKLVIDYAKKNDLPKLFVAHWLNVNDQQWRIILEHAYSLYPEEVSAALKDLLAHLDYSIFEKSETEIQLNDFLLQFV